MDAFLGLENLKRRNTYILWQGFHNLILIKDDTWWNRLGDTLDGHKVVFRSARERDIPKSTTSECTKRHKRLLFHIYVLYLTNVTLVERIEPKTRSVRVSSLWIVSWDAAGLIWVRLVFFKVLEVNHDFRNANIRKGMKISRLRCTLMASDHLFVRISFVLLCRGGKRMYGRYKYR